MLGARSSAHPLRAAPSIRLGPAQAIAVPEAIGTVKYVRQDIKTAMRMHAEPFHIYVGPVEIKQ